MVIASMSSEETCLQGFANDDIFGVIAFALVQIKAVGLRLKRTITVEEQHKSRRVGQGDSRIKNNIAVRQWHQILLQV